MDEEFLKLLEEMANTTDFPYEYRDIRKIPDESYVTADEKADQLINYVTDTSTIDDNAMPAYLKSQIMNRIHQPDIQRIVNNPDKKRPISKQLELFFYSCKVAGAVAAAFVMMITASATRQWAQENNVITETATQWAQKDNQAADDTIHDKFNKKSSLDSKKDNPSTGITEYFDKGSSLFTNWLQDIPNTLRNRNTTN